MKHKPNTLASKGQGKKQKKGVYTESQALTCGNPPEGHGSSWSAARTHPPDGQRPTRHAASLGRMSYTNRSACWKICYWNRMQIQATER